MLFEYVVIAADNSATYFKTAETLVTGDVIAAYLNNTLLATYTVTSVNPDGNIVGLAISANTSNLVVKTAVIV